LRIPPAQVAGEPTADARVVDGLVREALRQSTWFDVTTRFDEPDQGPVPAAAVQVTIDSKARTLAATLLVPDSPPLPLAGAEFKTTKLPVAIDGLCAR